MLLLCPAPLVYQHASEMVKRFGGLLTPHIFYGTRGSAPEDLRPYVVDVEQYKREMADWDARSTELDVSFAPPGSPAVSHGTCWAL
jgi:hypothetical protein